MASVTLQERAAPGTPGQPYPVIRGSVTLPRIGPWQANLWVNMPHPPAGPVAIAFGGGLTLLGTVNRANADQGMSRVRVLAGADGLRLPTRAKHYTSPTVRLVVGDLVRQAGETLADAADSGLLSRTLLSWTTVAGVPGGAMIAALLKLADPAAAWRMTAGGQLWVGRETWPVAPESDHVEIEANTEDGWVLLGVDAPRLLPGQVIRGYKADLVEHLIDPGRIRTRLWIAST